VTRVISGVILAAVAVTAILFLPFIALRLLACVVAGLAAHEYLKIVGGDHGAGAGALIACWFVADGTVTSLAAMAALTLILMVLSVMIRNASAASAAAGALATLYVGMPLGMLVAVHGAFGARLTLLTIATIVVSDTAQYYTGRTLGRHPLAPAISPKKTIEGAVGGLVLGTAFVAIVLGSVYGRPAKTAIPFGLAVVVLGIVGDLFESRLKRAAGVKDSSDLIPGHGGVLDRIDALLFAAPAFYVYFKA
jgi:phosphatidate cytidylyltransferase